MAKSILTIFILLSNVIAFSQWQFVNSGFNLDNIDGVKINESANTALICTENIYKSSDDGLSFQKIYDWQTYLELYYFKSATIVNSNNYIAVASDLFSGGLIASTLNGGTSWTRTYHSFNITDIEHNSTRSIAIGENGNIVTSINGGITWSSVSSGTTNNLKTIAYDQYSSQWIIGGENVRLTSSNGISWNVTYVNYEILNIQVKGSKIIETIDDNINYIKITDNFLSISHLISENNNYFDQCLLTNEGKFIISSGPNIYSSDTVNYNLFFTDYFIHNNLDFSDQKYINSIDVGDSYALAVGNEGSIGRYVLNSPIIEYIPADFQFSSSSTNNCSGSTYSAIPNYNYADSNKWYLNNILTSTDDTLTGIFPSQFGNLSIKLEKYHNGVVKTTTQTVYVHNNTEITTPIFTFTADTNLCYGEQGSFIIYQNQSSSMFRAKIIDLQDNSLIQDIALNQQNTTVQLGNLLIDRQIKIIIYFDNYCVYEERLIHQLNYHVDINLNNTYLIEEDTINVCPGILPSLAIYNTIDGFSYNIHFGSSGGSTVAVVSGSTNDTLVPLLNITNSTGGNSIYINITSPTGCIKQNLFLCNVIYSNPNANFSLINTINPIGDLLEITNYSPSYIDEWEVYPTISQLISSPNQVPIISSDTSGTFLLSLKVENQDGCKDSTSMSFTYAPKIEIAPTELCYLTEATPMNVIKSKLDHHGNLIEIGVIGGFYYLNYHNGVKFVIRKFNPSGILLWEKTLTNSSFSSTGNYAGLLTSFDIDEYDNIYSTLYLAPDTYQGFNFDLVQFTYTSAEHTANFLVKYSPNGEMLYAKKLSLYGNGNVSDILFDQDKLYYTYVGAGNFGYISLIKCDLEGNTLGYYDTEQSNYQSGQQIYFYSTTNAIQSLYLNPQIRKMNNGNIAIQSYTNPIFNKTLASGNVVTIPPKSSYILIFDPNVGFTNIKAITTVQNNLPSRIFNFSCDEDNNIYTYTYWSNNLPVILGEQQVNSIGLCVIKLDENLNPVWIRKGTGYNIKSIYSSPLDGAIYVSGLSNSNTLFETTPENYSIIQSNNTTYGYPFYLKMNENGMTLESATVRCESQNNNYAPHGINWGSSVVNPSGDLYFTGDFSYVSNPPVTVYDENQQIIIDSTFILRISTNSCDDNISYFNFSTEDTLTVCQINNSNYYSIEIYDKYNIDFIPFSVYSGTNLVVSSIENIEDNTVDFYTNASPPFKIITNYNDSIYDSLVVNIISNSPVDFFFDSIMCKESSQVITTSPFTGSVYFNNSTSSSTNYNVTVGNNSQNQLSIPIEIQYLNGCIIEDQININLINPVHNTYSYDMLVCTDQDVLINSSPSTNMTYWNGALVEQDNILIPHINSNLGENEVTVMSIDTNNCTLFDTLVYYENETILLPIPPINYIQCDDSLFFNYGWADINSAIWSNGTNSLICTYHYDELTTDTTNANVITIDWAGCPGETDFTIIKECDTSSLNNIYSSQLEIFPNPTSGTFILKCNSNLIGNEYSIIGMDSKTITEGFIVNEKTIIDLSQYSTGLYLIKLNSNGSNPINKRISKL